MQTCVRLEEATILHADAFFAAVEQRDEPRAFGVRGAMGGAQARRLCPQAIVVPPRFEAYVAASRELFEIFRHYSPHVEGISLEEAFLDVRGLEAIHGAPREVVGSAGCGAGTDHASAPCGCALAPTPTR